MDENIMEVRRVYWIRVIWSGLLSYEYKDWLDLCLEEN
jgi:hypothetical protein